MYVELASLECVETIVIIFVNTVGTTTPNFVFSTRMTTGYSPCYFALVWLSLECHVFMFTSLCGAGGTKILSSLCCVQEIIDFTVSETLQWERFIKSYLLVVSMCLLCLALSNQSQRIQINETVRNKQSRRR